MSVIARIRAHGGDAEMDRWNLRVSPGRMPREAVDWIRANREKLKRELWPEYDDWLERSAIREFDGGQDRAEADEAAYAEIVARC